MSGHKLFETVMAVTVPSGTVVVFQQQVAMVAA
jgi:hypothetical protein